MRLATAFLTIGWCTAMLLIGGLTYAALGWPVIVALTAVTVLVAVASHRKNNSWQVRVSVEQAKMLIRIGLCQVGLITVGAVLVITHHVWAGPQVLALLTVMCVSLLGAGTAGRKAQSGSPAPAGGGVKPER